MFLVLSNHASAQTEPAASWIFPPVALIFAIAVLAALAGILLFVHIRHFKATEAYKQDLERLKAAAYSGKVGLWELRPTERTFHADDSFKALLGYMPDELDAQLRTWYGMLWLDDWRKMRGSPRRGPGNSEPRSEFEHRMLHKDGSVRWFLTSASLAGRNAGHPMRVLGTSMDITERKSAGEALRQAEERLHAIIESADDMIYFLPLFPGKMQLLNDACVRVTGYSREKLETYPELWEQIVHPDDRNASFLFHKTHLAGCARHEKEYRLRSQTGEWKYLHSLMIGARDARGKYVGYYCIDRELTQMYKAEEALRASEAQLRAIFEHAALGIVRVTPDGAIKELNPAITNMIGYTQEEIFGTWISDHLIDGISEEEERQLDEMRAGVQLHITMEKRLRRKDGRTVWSKLSASCVQRPNGEPDFFIALAEDITEQREAEVLFTMLRDLGLALGSIRSLGEVLDRVLEAICSLEAVSAGGIYLIEPGTGHLKLMAHKGISETFATQAASIQSGPIEIWQAVPWSPLYLSMDAIPGLEEQAQLRHEGFRCGAMIPIHHEGIMLGSITAASRVYSNFPRNARSSLESIASHVGSVITRVRTEEALRESQERVRAFLDNVQDTIYFLSLNGDMRILTGGWKNAADYPSAISENDSMAWRACIHPDDLLLFEQHPANRHSYELEYRMKNKRGEWRWYQSRRNAAKTNGDPATGFYCVDRDITRTKQIEEVLRDTERRQADIISFLPDATFVINEEKRVIAWNRAMETLTGVPADEMLRQGDCRYSIPFYGIRRPMLIDMVHEPIEAIRPFYPDLHLSNGILTASSAPRELKDGKRHLLSTATPLYDAGGNRIGAIQCIRDITVVREAEAERERLELQMQQAQKLESLGVLAGGIAHDFNNLLMGVLGNASMALLEMDLNSPARNSIVQIETTAQRAAELTKQLLAYSGRGKFVVEPINLSMLVHETAHLLEVSISKKAAIRYHLAEDLPAIEADASQIRQVIMNLITNASDAIVSENGTITITTGACHCTKESLRDTYLADDLKAGKYAFAEVADTGMGMDEETIQRIFDPFFTTKFTGRGLGLAAVLGIVRGHGGALKVDSEPGRGSVFRVYFPTCDRQPIRSAPPAASMDAWHGSGLVLFADDETSVRSLGERILKRAGFSVAAAADGQEAVEIFRARASEVKLVLLDMTMPIMNGEEAFRAMRDIREDIPILLSSGYNEQDAVQSFMEGGLAGFIQKPYRPSELITLIRNVLSKSATT